MIAESGRHASDTMFRDYFFVASTSRNFSSISVCLKTLDRSDSNVTPLISDDIRSNYWNRAGGPQS